MRIDAYQQFGIPAHRAEARSVAGGLIYLSWAFGIIMLTASEWTDPTRTEVIGAGSPSCPLFINSFSTNPLVKNKVR
jgi:hypothetical protein